MTTLALIALISWASAGVCGFLAVGLMDVSEWSGVLAGLCKLAFWVAIATTALVLIGAAGVHIHIST